MYNRVVDIKKRIWHYTLCGYSYDELIEVMAVSTCGMMISKEIFNQLGGWPKELGIYGGGENFMNYVMATQGFKKYIYPAKKALYHHGEKRGYSWNYDDHLRNRAIATYFITDDKGCKGAPDLIVEILSPASLNMDLKTKLFLYEKHKVTEYWIIHPDEKLIEIFKIGKDKKYKKPEMYTEEDIIKVESFPGLEIDLKRIFSS